MDRRTVRSKNQLLSCQSVYTPNSKQPQSIDRSIYLPSARPNSQSPSLPPSEDDSKSLNISVQGFKPATCHFSSCSLTSSNTITSAYLTADKIALLHSRAQFTHQLTHPPHLRAQKVHGGVIDLTTNTPRPQATEPLHKLRSYIKG